MARKHIDHRQIKSFADRVVNLKRDDAKEYRDQVRRLRERLNVFVGENPDFELKKMLLSGSLAKHTALKTINDADVAVYVDSAPDDIGELPAWLAEKLRNAFPNISSDQVVVQNYSVKIEFRGTGLNIDVVPVYFENDEDWGNLVSQEDGTRVRTNIRLHKEFIAKRRIAFDHYAQIVRLLKWWVRNQKQENDEFRFKSFMIELIVAKMFDDGRLSNENDYPTSMLEIFDYIARTNLGERIFFTDYKEIPVSSDSPIQVFDPVNAGNNVASKYTERDRGIMVDAAIDAGDAIEAALKAPTLGLTLHYWRNVLGSSFST